MKDIYLGLKFTFSYFTILPIKFNNTDDLSKDKVIQNMLFFIPFIGLVLGVLIFGLYSLIDDLNWVALLLSAIGYMALYGFLHTEAILDVVDALYAKHSGKDAYKIIKEPTVGAMGILFGISFVILKISFIVYILQFGLWLEFISVIIFSRFSLLLNIFIFTFHKSSSFIDTMKTNITSKFLFLTFIAYFFIGFNLISFDIFLIVFSVILTSLLVVFYLKEKLGFANGDILGSSLEISELIGFFIVILYFI